MVTFQAHLQPTGRASGLVNASHEVPLLTPHDRRNQAQTVALVTLENGKNVVGGFGAGLTFDHLAYELAAGLATVNAEFARLLHESVKSHRAANTAFYSSC